MLWAWGPRLRAGHPRVITLDAYAASHRAVTELKSARAMPQRVGIRSSKYSNNVVEQDHRRIKQQIRLMLGFKRFETAAITISGIELAEKIRKHQFKTGKLLRNSPGTFERNEFEAHCLRLGAEFGLLAFLITDLIGSESAVVELLACGHQMKDDPSQLVGSSRDGFRSAKFCSHASIEIAQRALAVVKGLGGHTKRRGGSAVYLPCANPKDFAAADVVVRT